MKLAIIGLLAVVLLGGGAAGAYFYFSKPAEAASGAVDEVAKAEHDAKKEAAEGAEVAKEEFVQLPPLILPIIGDRGVMQTVSLVISVEVPDAAAAEEVKRLSPRLQDALLQEMYGTLNRKDSMEKEVLQVGPIKARLNRIANKVLGEDNVNEVLLQVIQQRRI